MDIIYVKNISGTNHVFLSQLDDGTTYHVADYLKDRSEESIIHALVHGWFRFFGFPDELLLDAEGGMKGMSFDQLCAQAGIRVRFVPADAHWQLGKAERHGQTLKHIMKRLINQFAACTVSELELICAMATFAKNTLARKSGASPAQWVYGRNPRVPAALLSEPESIEAKQVIEDSEKYRQIEAVRHAAMQEFLQMEYSEALRKAILRKNRPFRGPFTVGQRIAYFRLRNQLDGEGSAEGYRQGLIIGLDPGPTGSVWVRNNRGRVVQVLREQVRGIEGEELWSSSSDELKMLKSAEEDLSRKHARAFKHEGPGPQEHEDKLILDAAGDVVAGLQAPPVVLALPLPESPPDLERLQIAPPTPAPGMPDTPRPSPPPAKRLKSISEHAVAGPSDLQDQVSGWFLDPDGRPTVVVDNATTFRTPTPRFSADEFGYRTSWSLHGGNWQKIEDRVKWGELEDAVGQLPKGPVDKLVTTFSPSLERGLQPSIASAEEVQRTQTKRSVPEISSSSSSAGAKIEEIGATPVPVPSVIPEAGGIPSESTGPAAVLLTFCESCGCRKQEMTSPPRCARCFAMHFVEDPRQVDNWFDEIEERSAYDEFQSMQYNPRYKEWYQPPLTALEEIQLPEHEQLDNFHETESYILDVGQIHRAPPESHSSHDIWSVAVKDKDTGDWNWSQLFEDIHVNEDTFEEHLKGEEEQPTKKIFLQHSLKAIKIKAPRRFLQARPKRVGRHRWLQRHGRHCVYLIGWDGSSPEIQPYFEQNAFSKSYHAYVTAVANNETTTLDEQVNEDAKAFILAGRPEWCRDMWKPKNVCDVFHTSGDHTAILAGPDNTSGEEGEEPEGGGRALKQALKRETPWRSISKEHVIEFIKAMREEWSEWENWSSCRPIKAKSGEIPNELILRSRVCYRWKPKDGGKWFKAKARIVVQGYRDPHLPLLSRDAPVLAKTSLILLIQWAACFNVSLWNGDCKSAFLQGEPDTERPVHIYMRPPTDDIALAAVPQWCDRELLYELTAPVYGQANAPRRWFLHVLKVLTGLAWEQHTLDPCCFIQRKGSQVVALLGVHVDDIICCCLPGHEELLEQVRSSFAWGSEWEHDDFIFVGRRISRQEDGGYKIDQTHYVAEVSLTKINLEPEASLNDHPELITEFRSGIGSLQWLAGTMRGDLSSDVSLLQKPPKELKVADLKEVNKVLKYVRATADAYYKVTPIKVENLIFLAYGDSGFANAPNNKSQGGYVILATDKAVLSEERPASLLEWKSYRHQRVLRSTLAAEAASLDKAQDMGHFMACVFSEMVDGNHRASTSLTIFEVIPVTDARSLWDAIHRLSTTFSEKRVEIDVSNLRSTCRSLRWVPTEKQHADVMTKRCPKLRDAFRRWAMSPVATLVESKTAEDGEDNGFWRDPSMIKEKNVTSEIVKTWLLIWSCRVLSFIPSAMNMAKAPGGSSLGVKSSLSVCAMWF